MSFSTAATIADRFSVFAQWSEANGDKYMEYVSREDVIAYGQELAERVESGEMSEAYAQNLVSAVNTVMSLATQGRWESVSPTKECGIEQRSTARDEAPRGLDREIYSRALEAVRQELGDRAAAVVELCRELGLRSKEASLLDARSAALEASERGYVTISEGTKGGRTREVPIASPRALEALERASAAQGGDRSLIPADQSWRQWREGALRDAREIVQEHTGGGLHDLRSAWACERFSELTGHDAPVAGGYLDRESDREAMTQLAEELGHGRTDVLHEYIGR
jgi:site-specific recombinase XerC